MHDPSRTPRTRAKDDTSAAPLIPDASLSDACRQALANQAMAFSIRNKDFEPLYANKAYLQLFDTTLDEWMQGPSAAHLGPQARDFVETVIVPTLLAGKSWKGEIEVHLPQGERKQVLTEMSCTRDETGEISHYYATYIDLTYRRQLEADLQNQVDFLNAILDTLPDIVLVKDSEHRWVVVNDKFCSITGFPREELIGKSDYDVFPKEQADYFWKQDDKALKSKGSVTNEERISTNDGTTRLLSTTKSPLKRSDGSTVVVALGHDITAKRKLEQSMAESYQQLEGVLASLKGGLAQIQSSIASEASKADAVQGLIGSSNERFRHFLKETGLAPATPAPSRRVQAQPLSPREYQVTLLLAKGKRIKDIAAHLKVSPNTVSTYRTRIMKKLHLTTQTELVHYAIRHGLL